MRTKPRPRIDEGALLKAWNSWNTRSRHDYLEAILKLSPKERKMDRGASWGSILNIFLHILEDYLWWYDAVPSGKQDSEALVGKDLSDEELRNLNHRIDVLVAKRVRSLHQGDLGKWYSVNGLSGDGKPYTMTTCLADILWHLVEEQLQHLGEINALLWQMDIDPPTHAWFSSKLSFTQ